MIRSAETYWRIYVRTETNIGDEQTALVWVETVWVKLVSSWYRGACSCQFGAILQSWFHFFVRFSPNYPVGFLDFFQFPRASAEHCKAQLSIFAQVDNVGNAWVAGRTRSSLDGHANAGEYDIFLMKFDAQGVHLWTRQRGGWGNDHARALQADGVRLRFRIFYMEEKHGKTLEPLARSMFWVRWNGITVCGSILIVVPSKKVDTVLFASRIGNKWIRSMHFP